MPPGSRQQRLEAGRRQARLWGAGGFVVAAVAPVVLFGRVIEVLAVQPKLELHYLTGWLPWLLLAVGLVFLAPVAWSAGMRPDHRLFPRARTAYAGWGVTLYLLGLLLAWQVAAVQDAALR